MRTSFVTARALNLLLVIFLLAGCGSKSPKTEEPEPAPDQSAVAEEQDKDKEAENKNKIEGINGFRGEINGTPVPGSKLGALQIGMTVQQVIAVAGKPTWRGTYGRPFDFSGDRTAFILLYRNRGSLIFTGGKLFDSSKGNLITINHNEKEVGYKW